MTTTLTLPAKKERQHLCTLPWYADCDKCAREDYQWLNEVEEWTKTAYDPETTGILTYQREVSKWSKREKRFVWVKEEPVMEWVLNHRVHENGDISYRRIQRKKVWSRMGSGDAGYTVYWADYDEIVRHIKRGAVNAKGYPSVRYANYEFTPLSAIPKGERVRRGWNPWEKFGGSRAWTRSYCD